MVKYFYKSLRSQSMQQLSEYKRGVWVYAEAPSADEIQALTDAFDLELGIALDALDENEMPRLEKGGEQNYIFVRYARKDGEGGLETMPLLFVFVAGAVITISPTKLPCIDKFLKGKIDFATTQRTKLILQILNEIVEGFDGLITQKSKQIKAIRARLRGHEITDQDFIDFVMVEDELNEFLSSLMPTNAVLNKLLRGKHIPLFEEDHDLIEDLVLSNEQSIEACSSNIKSIVGIRDAHSSISANSLNRTMKILTIATLGIAIPNMFFGLYSMNVDIPLQREPWIFWVVIGFTVVVTTMVFVVGRRKRIF